MRQVSKNCISIITDLIIMLFLEVLEKLEILFSKISKFLFIF